MFSSFGFSCSCFSRMAARELSIALIKNLHHLRSTPLLCFLLVSLSNQKEKLVDPAKSSEFCCSYFRVGPCSQHSRYPIICPNAYPHAQVHGHAQVIHRNFGPKENHVLGAGLAILCTVTFFLKQTIVTQVKNSSIPYELGGNLRF